MNVIFWPGGFSTEASPEETLLQAAVRAGVSIDAACGGSGGCGRCKVRLCRGEASPLTEREQRLLSRGEITMGWRLACRARAVTDLEVAVPAAEELAARKKDLAVLPADQIFDGGEGWGVSFDLGTTTVVGTLWENATGKATATAARSNPQRVFGADVISRIRFAGEAEGNLSLLQKALIGCMNDILAELCGGRVAPEDITAITAVGNTTMSHLFLGLSPETLARAPFTPAFHGAVKRSAVELGLQIRGDAPVHLLPNIAGHVGSDTVGVLLATKLHRRRGCHVVIDIGTNGEVAAVKDDRLLVCSTAAGPAFEGACIRCGMRAAAGAIEEVRLSDGNITVSTIDGLPAVGICGSGLIDAVAALLEAGIITPMGRLLTREEAAEESISPALAERLVTVEGRSAFTLAENVVLTQQDIREVQLAKGAILAGVQTLLAELGAAEIDSLLLAGAFGSYIRKESALRIGLLPSLEEERISSVGNAAAAGAAMALLSQQQRQLAKTLAEQAEHIELSTHPAFEDYYMEAMLFGEE